MKVNLFLVHCGIDLCSFVADKLSTLTFFSANIQHAGAQIFVWPRSSPLVLLFPLCLGNFILHSLLALKWQPSSPSHASAVRPGLVTGERKGGRGEGLKEWDISPSEHLDFMMTTTLTALRQSFCCLFAEASNLGVIMILLWSTVSQFQSFLLLLKKKGVLGHNYLIKALCKLSLSSFLVFSKVDCHKRTKCKEKLITLK